MNRISRRVLFVCAFLILLALLPHAPAGAQERKVALVIGNGDYQDLGRLSNPPNDARDMAAALRRIGFDVEVIVDGSRREMERAVVNLGNRLSSAEDTTGFFFFAGHGVQSGGANYLIPSGAEIPSEEFLPDRSLSAQVVLSVMQRAGNELNVVVLDACRDNPFGWNRTGLRGLSALSSQPPGSIIAYATSAGSVAQDGTGRNGVFTGELLRHIGQPGLDIDQVFKRTGQGVVQATGGRQVPAVYSQFFDTAYLAGAPTSGPGTGSGGPGPASLPQRPDSRGPLRNEIFIQGGTFRMGSASGGHDDERPVHTVRLDDFYMMATEVTFQEYDAFARATGRDRPDDWGWGRGTRPVINVSWHDAVAYANWLSERDGLTRAYRISGTNVTWNRNADGWRLPTEAEWEYAARGGQNARNTTYAGSSTVGTVAWYSGNANSRTQPVGQKQANELGLYDMSGNVWEWCYDWYDWDYYGDSPSANPTGPTSGSRRVLRGGSWGSAARDLRVADRGNDDPGFRLDRFGFRLVRAQFTGR